MATTAFARWRLSDGVQTYSFQINPSETDSPFRDNAVEPLTTTDNQTLLVQGVETPRTMTFSGTLLDPDQYDQLLSWLRVRRRVYLYDHFDRQMVVVVTSYQPKPPPAPTTNAHPYKHEYTISVIVLQEPDSL